MRSRPAAFSPTALLAGLAALVGACGQGPTPARFLDLSTRFQPDDLRARIQDWNAAAGLDRAALKEVEAGFELRLAVRSADWRAEESGRWSTDWPGGAFDFGYAGFLRLEEAAPQGSAPRQVWRPESATQTLERVAGRLRLATADGLAPPDGVLVQRLEQGRRVAGGRSWQLRANTFYGNGIPVWSAAPVELECDLPQAARLSFGTRFLAQPGAERVTFRVRLDGRTVHESVLEPAAFVSGAEHAVVLPSGRPRTARLVLEVLGPPGQGLFTHPTLGPAAIGDYGQRPWKGAPPDIVLFLADTFRADNLAAYGGAAQWTPHLNAFAEASTTFLRARSVASWTLPAISSLLTGLWPPQHTAEDHDRSLPQELVTIVERLAQAGYRTCAVTDSGFFVQSYGLDQGFESFKQITAEEWDLDLTLAFAHDFLAADDGRPLFLLVHTYRTHIPYRVGPEELLGPYAELAARHPLVNAKEHMDPALYDRSLAESVEGYRELYRAGVQDLDAGFGRFQAELERLGILGRGLVLFTSDHGEALGENREIFHDGDLWETKLRIPLCLNGPGFGPRVESTPVALVDLAPTLARVAGLPRDPAWAGQPLDSVPGERPLWAFRSRARTLKQIALAEGLHKLLVRDPARLELGQCDEAYDLARDPGELENLCGSAAWTSQLARERAGAALRVRQPVTEHQETVPTDELRAIGYGGE